MTQLAREHGRIRRQEGVATVLAAIWTMVLALVAGVGLVAAVATARQHQVDASADLAAVSAAAALQRGRDPCAAAQRIAAAQHTSVHMCRVVGSDVIVSVRGRVALPFGLHPLIGAFARAGPS